MIKRKPKKTFYFEKQKFQGDAKKAPCIMKELADKSGINKSSFLHKIVIDKTEVLVKPMLQIFTNIGPKLA